MKKKRDFFVMSRRRTSRTKAAQWKENSPKNDFLIAEKKNCWMYVELNPRLHAGLG
jgi:hypothetical protein